MQRLPEPSRCPRPGSGFRRLGRNRFESMVTRVVTEGRFDDKSSPMKYLMLVCTDPSYTPGPGHCSKRRDLDRSTASCSSRVRQQKSP